MPEETLFIKCDRDKPALNKVIFLRNIRPILSRGFEDVFLYITQCKNTIFEGELINSDRLKHIYTSKSILSVASEKITVFSPVNQLGGFN